MYVRQFGAGVLPFVLAYGVDESQADKSVLFRIGRLMLGGSWAKKPGDYWYQNDPSEARFFNAWVRDTGSARQYVLAIGRLVFVLYLLYKERKKTLMRQ